MVAVLAKGVLSGGGCCEAKLMWLGGWKSFVAMRRRKGRVSRLLIMGLIVRPSGTARAPFWGGQM